MSDATAATNVVALHDDIILPNSRAESVVDLLTLLLAEAERGEIVGIAVATLNPAHDVICNWQYEGANNGLLLVGATARLLYRLNKGQD